jgi:hypothetical protein
MAHRDSREWIEHLEGSGELGRVRAEVNWEREMVGTLFFPLLPERDRHVRRPISLWPAEPVTTGISNEKSDRQKH